MEEVAAWLSVNVVALSTTVMVVPSGMPEPATCWPTLIFSVLVQLTVVVLCVSQVGSVNALGS